MSYNHPSWTLEQWESLWPRRTGADIALSMSGCSIAFQRLWQSDSDVLTVMTGRDATRQVSLASVRHFSQRLDKWMQSPTSEEEMTLPPSPAGFQRAIAHEIENNPSLDLKDGCFAVALLTLRPLDVARAFRFVAENKLSDDWKNINAQLNPRAVVAKTVDPVQDTAVANPIPEVVKDETKEKPERFNPQIKRFEFSEQQKNEGKKLLQWLAQAQESTVSSVQCETFDGLLKKDIMEQKGPGAQAANYWLEDVGLVGLATLQIEEMDNVLKVWPFGADMTLDNPMRSLEQRKFWLTHRMMKTNARTHFLEQILPRVVDGKEWSNDHRYEIIAPMVEGTQRTEWLFEERLKLWLAWGGNLDAQVPKPSQGLAEESSMFEDVEVQSVREWIEEQKVEAWNRVLEDKYPRPRSKSGLSM